MSGYIFRMHVYHYSFFNKGKDIQTRVSGNINAKRDHTPLTVQRYSIYFW